MNTKDIDRARWVAELAIAYTGVMTDAQRLTMLGSFFDHAYYTGVRDEIKSANEELINEMARETESLMGHALQAVK